MTNIGTLLNFHISYRGYDTYLVDLEFSLNGSHKHIVHLSKLNIKEINTILGFLNKECEWTVMKECDTDENDNTFCFMINKLHDDKKTVAIYCTEYSMEKFVLHDDVQRKLLEELNRY